MQEEDGMSIFRVSLVSKHLILSFMVALAVDLDFVRNLFKPSVDGSRRVYLKQQQKLGRLICTHVTLSEGQERIFETFLEK